MVKLLISLVISLASVTAVGVIRCRNAHQPFASRFERKIYDGDRDRAMIESFEFQMDRMQSPELKLKFVERMLGARGVKAQVKRLRTAPLGGFMPLAALIGESFVVIEPIKNGRFINDLAFKMMKNFGVEVVYSLNLESHVAAQYNPEMKRIYISRFSALSGLVDQSLIHEIRHAAMFFHENKNEHHIVNGFVWKEPGAKFPWMEKSEDYPSYENFMSMQELRTYALNRNLEIVDYIRRLKEMDSLSQIEAISVAFPREDLFQRIDVILKYFEENLTDDKMIYLQENSKDQNIVISTSNKQYMARMIVPKSFYEKEMEKNRFRVPLGRSDLQVIARDYLQTFRDEVAKDIQQERKYFEMIETLEFVARYEKAANMLQRLRQVRNSRELFSLSDSFGKEIQSFKEKKIAQFEKEKEKLGLSYQKVEKEQFLASMNHDVFSPHFVVDPDLIVVTRFSYIEDGRTVVQFDNIFPRTLLLEKLEKRGLSPSIEILVDPKKNSSQGMKEAFSLNQVVRELQRFGPMSF